ncbi:LysR family transcriptional regulator [Salinisphaera sp.]|uniref:LysR family transcriptional regulator n=1 Tax=Salinisphaera sp. TaxID=1914330 RepID=UPI000C585852|nr:LysR family transcriptional regulator [Salinisphaera sp.]MBS61502.1 LysR family transcriptional regulator [Salinisphaera sp.]
MSTLDWEGLKTFALVCRGGTMSAAARELGVNQTTVARRLQRLEQQLGQPLLRRDGPNLRATAHAEALLETARAMEDRLAATLTDVHTRPGRQPVSGLVRITGVDGVLEHAVAPRINTLLTRHPGLRIDLIGGNRNLRVAQREADIALRLARPAGTTLDARRLGDLAYGIYAADAKADPHRAPWVDLDEAFIDKPEQQWLAERFPERRTLLRANRGGIIGELALATGACCLMPRCIGDRTRGLAALDTEATGRELWLVRHQDMAHLPRLRVVADWLADTLCDGRWVVPAH